MSQLTHDNARASRIGLALLLSGASMLALPQFVSSQEYPLFDKFSLRLGASQNFLNTSIRLDSKELGIGTEIDFEDDVDLASDEFTPDLGFQWHFRPRQEIGVYWSDLDRSSATLAAKEIRFGDLVIPLEGRVLVGFDITTYRVGYTYFPLVKDRLAVGVGGGVRVLDITTSLTLEVLPGEIPPLVVAEAADVTGPLPFVNAEVRYGVSPHWRFASSLGYFDVTIGDVKGTQVILDAEIENLVGDHFSWGFSGNYSAVDIDSETEDFLGHAQLDIGFVRLFVKGRF